MTRLSMIDSHGPFKRSPFSGRRGRRRSAGHSR